MQSLKANKDEDSAGPLLSGAELACYRGGREVFENLNFRLEAGETLVITGPNGSGKSTLLRLVAGLIRHSAGSLDYCGEPVEQSLDSYRQETCYVGHAEAIKNVLSVQENLSFWDRGRDPRAVSRALERFDLSALCDMPAKLLSSGQRRRLALSRLLVSGARLWLLDEPTVGLDLASQERLRDVLVRHGDEGGAAMLTTHSPIDLPRTRSLALEDFAITHSPELIW